jgi:hypothetical protein
LVQGALIQSDVRGGDDLLDRQGTELNIPTLFIDTVFVIKLDETPHRGAIHDGKGTFRRKESGRAAPPAERGRGKIRLAVGAANGFGMNRLFAKRTDPAMGAFLWENRRQTVLAPNGVYLDRFFAKWTRTGR